MTTCTHVPRAVPTRPLVLSLSVTAGFMVLEFLGGLFSGSLALVSDAGHMLADVGALALSLFALWLARRPPDPKRTFGYYRIEILAALANGAFLWVLVVFILREAALRLTHPRAIAVPWMLGIGLAGLAVNLVSLVLLHRSQKESLNVRAAFLHVLGDALGSVGVVVAALVVLATGWSGADAVAGAVIGLLILYSSWGLMREAVNVLLEGSPAHIEVDHIHRSVLEVDGVAGVHDLHLWSLTPQVLLFTAHVVKEEGVEGGDAFRRTIEDKLAREFGIRHATLQIESKPCLDAEEDSSHQAVEPPGGHDHHGCRHRH